jgi:hypothetical protein
MVNITRETVASELVASKARNTWIRKLSDFVYCVTPKSPGTEREPNTKRRVTLTLLRGNRLWATCESYYTGEPCPANQFGNLCYSVWKVISHLEKQAKRQERRAALEPQRSNQWHSLKSNQM